MMYSHEHISAYSFMVLVRKEYRNRPHERDELQSLLQSLVERYNSPVYLMMSKRNNIPLSHFSLLSRSVYPIVFEEFLSAGHYINCAIARITEPYCCVIWSDMVADLHLDEKLTRWLLIHEPLCAAPILYDNTQHLIPTITSPLSYSAPDIKTMAVPPGSDGDHTLYPFDYVGIYDTAKIKRMDGFDTDFEQGYWQLCDFGFSSWLRGEKITGCNGILYEYNSQPPVEDHTATKHGKRFRAKHFGYTIGPSGSVELTRRQRNQMPPSFINVYLSSPAKVVMEGDELISRWETHSENL